MATWTSTEIYWSGKFLTVSDWNKYFGANGNLASLKETYGYYNASFYNRTFVLQSTTTNMRLTNNLTSYRIPMTWGSGTYALRMDVFTSQTTEAAADTRRICSIVVNGITSWVNTQYSVVSTRKPIYHLSMHKVLQPNDLIEYRFFQPNIAGSFLMSATIQKIGQ